MLHVIDNKLSFTKRLTNFFLVIFLLISFKTLACECIDKSIDKNFLRSDFVAKVKVLKKYENVKSAEYYKADIEILDSYKGEKKLKSIFIYGNYKHPQDSACWIYTEENEKLIVYGIKEENKIMIPICSRVTYLDKKSFTHRGKKYDRQKLFDEEIEILKVLKKNKIDYKNTGKLRLDIHSFLRLINIDLNKDKSIDLNGNFAIYEFCLGEDFDVRRVKAIKGFNRKVDKRIKKILKKQKWSYKYGIENDLETHPKSFIIIYYKISEEGYKYLYTR